MAAGKDKRKPGQYSSISALEENRSPRDILLEDMRTESKSLNPYAAKSGTGII